MTAAKPTHAPLDIKIIGAGIAGLSASIACAQAGHRVEVLERAGELAEVGAGFQITPNASKCLKGFGVLDRLVPYAAVATVFLVRRWSDGHVLARTDDFDADMMRRYDAPFLGLHRVDVQRILAGRAEELGVRIRFGAMVEEIDLHRSGVVLKTGERLDADLMVGADGLWSKSRQSFLTAQDLPEDAPLPTGDLAYRIVLDIQDVEDEEIRGLITNPSCQFWIGPGAHVVLYSIRSGTVANIVLLVPDNLPPDVARQPGDVEEMRAIFNDWDPVLLRFLNHVKKVDKWKLMHRPELQSWISPEANFVFVGDACHPMLPYLAQGANTSIEDGAVLGYILATVQKKDQLPAALKLYEQLRKKRGEAIARETFAQRHDFHMADGPEQQARDELMLSKLGQPIDCKFPSRWQCPIVQPWIYGYDARQETDAALRQWPLDEG